MNTWIRQKFGTQRDLDRQLSLPVKTVNRWLNSDPRSLLRYISELSELSDTKMEVIARLVIEREKQNKCIAKQK